MGVPVAAARHGHPARAAAVRPIARPCASTHDASPQRPPRTEPKDASMPAPPPACNRRCTCTRTRGRLIAVEPLTAGESVASRARGQPLPLPRAIPCQPASSPRKPQRWTGRWKACRNLRL
jgi:hypothetical protein